MRYEEYMAKRDGMKDYLTMYIKQPTYITIKNIEI